MAAGIGSRFGTGIKQLEPVDDSNHPSLIPFFSRLGFVTNRSSPTS